MILGFAKSGRNVISGWSKLLEVSRLADPHEGIVGFLTIERIRLHPFLAAGEAVEAGGTPSAAIDPAG